MIEAEQAREKFDIRLRRTMLIDTVQILWIGGLRAQDIQQVIGDLGNARSLLNRLREREAVPRRRAVRSKPFELDILDFDVKRLRNQGLGNRQISEELNKPIHMVKDSVERMLANKQVEPRNPPQSPLLRTA